MVFLERFLGILLFTTSCITPIGGRRPPEPPGEHVAQTALESTLLIRRASGGLGSGFVWDYNTVITAAHVVRNSPEDLIVTTRAGEKCTVVSVTKFKNVDMAKVKVNKCFLTPFSRHGSIALGMTIYTSGHPMARKWTVSRGMVTNTDIEIGEERLVMTDASANPGSSGGPVTDKYGALVGMIVRIHTTSGMFAGMSYFVPIDVMDEHLSRPIGLRK